MSQNPEDKALYAAAVIGKDAEQFMQSELGQIMLGMAEQDAQEATDKLKTMIPWPARRVMRVQNDIAKAESFPQYLMELYERGKQALHQLETRDE